MSGAEHIRPPSKDTAERLAAIVDAAEQAALKVIDDAEEEARRYLEAAQGRADRIVAEALRERADELEGGVIEGGAEVHRIEPEDARPHLREALNGSSAARLLATQMAVSGSTRKEIEARLRNAFEIEDTAEILDAILGPED
jgi:phytoene dehydrogenase-like protein